MANRFHWILEGKVAGMELPGSIDPLIDDLMFLMKQDIDTIVTLTEEPHPRDSHLARRFTWIHFPIDDFSIPNVADAYELIRQVHARVTAGHRAVFHCYAGIGRTGTMLACYMVFSTGQAASGVIPWLRTIDRAYIQTPGQEDFVKEFEHYHRVVLTGEPGSET